MRDSGGNQGRIRRTCPGRGTGIPSPRRLDQTRRGRDEKPPEDNFEALKRESRAIEARLRHLGARIREIEQGRTHLKYKAVADAEKCLGCGACLATCPTGALSLGEIARIDVSRCVGCGRCIGVCAQGALSLMPVDAGSQEPTESIP